MAATTTCLTELDDCWTSHRDADTTAATPATRAISSIRIARVFFMMILPLQLSDGSVVQFSLRRDGHPTIDGQRLAMAWHRPKRAARSSLAMQTPGLPR
ncbi:hypothetical protein D3C87_1936710 [compost metagenome]